MSPILCDRCSGRKTLPPVPLFNVHLHGIRFPLITLFSITALICLFLAAIRLFGFTGTIVFCDIVVLLIGIANLRRIRSAFGVPVPKVTIVEFLALMGMCLMLHILSMPAVQSKRPLRATPVTPAPAIVPPVAKSPSPNTKTDNSNQ